MEVRPNDGRASQAGPGEPLQDIVDRLQGDLAELRGSRRRLVEAAHADRRGLERAFHDGVQQDLIALAADVQRLAGLVDRDPAAAKGLLDEMAANLRETLTQATALARKVYPPMLDGRGLAMSLRSAAASAGVTTKRAFSPPRKTGHRGGRGFPPTVRDRPIVGRIKIPLD